MSSRTTEYTSSYYVNVKTHSVTVDLRTLAGGPMLTSAVRDGVGCRAIMVADVTGGTTLEVTRLDGRQVVLTRKAAANVEYAVQAAKVRPTSTITSYIVLW